MNKKIYTVKMEISKNTLVEGIYLKEFFIFCGLYVDDIVVDITNNISISFDNNNFITIKLDKIWYLTDFERRKEFGNYILINNICKKLEFSCFYTLAEIFINKDFAYKNYYGRLYYNQLDEKDKLELARYFSDCFNKLHIKYKTQYSQYVKYAFLNCARKSNYVYDACNYQMLFDNKKLIKEAKELLLEDSNFDIVYVLMGKITSTERITWYECEDYLNKAISLHFNDRYSLFIRYYLNGFYDHKGSGSDINFKILKRMEKIDDSNYKMLFQLGWYNYYNNNPEQAVYYLSKLFHQLDSLGKLITPSQMEYRWKSAFLLSKSEILEKYVNDRYVYIDGIEKEFISDSDIEERFTNGGDKEKFSEYFKTKLGIESLNNIFS